MQIYDKVFWFIAFFLIGVLEASFMHYWGSGFLAAVLFSVLLSAILFIFGIKKILFFPVFAILGAGYYFAFNAVINNHTLNFGSEIKLEGYVYDVFYGADK